MAASFFLFLGRNFVTTFRGAVMRNKEEARDYISIKWVFLLLLFGFAVCVLLLPRAMASAIDTVSFLERLATRAEKAPQLPPETRRAISTVLTDHNRHNIKFKNQLFEARRTMAISRLEAVLNKPTTLANVPTQ